MNSFKYVIYFKTITDNIKTCLNYLHVFALFKKANFENNAL